MRQEGRKLESSTFLLRGSVLLPSCSDIDRAFPRAPHHADARMVPQGGRVLVALSGGPDSVALLHLLRELAATRRRWSSPASAHFNHQLRGAEARRRRGVLPRRWRRRWICRFVVGTRRRARAARARADARSRTRRAPRATRSSNDAADALGARRDCRRPQPRRSGRDLPAAADPRRRPARPRRHPAARRAASSVRCSRSRAQELRRLRGRARSARFARTRRTRDLEIPRNRVRHELLPHLERSFRRASPTCSRARRPSRGRTKNLCTGCNRSGRSIVLVSKTAA